MVRVAAGVFAPGHLGELTQVMPFELVDAVLAETGGVQHRLRALPSRVGVYFLLAMCLFPEVGYRLVWDKMTGALAGLPAVVSPTAKALRDLRRRVGGGPMQALFEVLCGPLARPMTPGVRFGSYRTVSFDGCSSLKVPDTGRNRGWLDRLAHGGYPQLELMTLVETGTRAVIGAVFGPTATGGSPGWPRPRLQTPAEPLSQLPDGHERSRLTPGSSLKENPNAMSEIVAIIARSAHCRSNGRSGRRR
ncbi:transposase domain-containing protein [Microbispora hainanensis]